MAQEDWIRLDNGLLQAAVDPQGAQLSVLRDLSAGRDLLWHGDPAHWSGRAPILFPIVGSLNDGRYRQGGAIHSLPRHGFARGRRFTVVAQSAEAVRLRLADDAETYTAYPFDFELDVEFHLDGPTLSCVATVCNTGDAPLPASIGFHPAFRWPLPEGTPRTSQRIRFAEEEPSAIRRLDADGLLRPEGFPSPVEGRVLKLDDALFAQDVLIFDQLRSRSLWYGAEHGDGIDIRFPDARYLGIWTKPGAPFLCIEPWRGVADPAGYVGEFSAKPGIEMLEHLGDTLRLTMQISVRPLE